MKKIFIAVIAFVVSGNISAQDFETISQKIIAAGPMTADNVATITRKITTGLPDSEKKAQAIYAWIANNIAIDPKAAKNFDKKLILPEQVILNRKGNSLGFANLFQEMASQANIRCLVVDGFIKKNIAEINEPVDEVNYSWNVVQLGTSPEQWYYVDAMAAAGSLDAGNTVFVKSYSKDFFFDDKNAFNFRHYPDNTAWLLGKGAKSKKEFYAGPFVAQAAGIYKLSSSSPASGMVKAKLNKPQKFILNASGKVTKVEVQFGSGKKIKAPETVQFTENPVTFEYTFKKEEDLPMMILFDGKPVLGYMITVTEK